VKIYLPLFAEGFTGGIEISLSHGFDIEQSLEASHRDIRHQPNGDVH
jgi:hypothetical protein